MAKKKVNKKWKDLTKFQKKIPIEFEGETLFEIQELSNDKLEEIVEKLIKKTEADSKEGKEIEETILDIDNNVELIASMIRSMVTQIDFDELNDVQIVETLNEMSQEVIEQVNFALNELGVEKIQKRLKSFMDMVEDLAEKKAEFDIKNKIKDRVRDEIVKIEGGIKNRVVN